jgi:hypothetical protein
MRDKLLYEGWSSHPALPAGWLARVAEQAPGSGRRWGVFLTAEGAVLPGRLALRAAEGLPGTEEERQRLRALFALGPGALGSALVDHWVHDTVADSLQHQVAAGHCSKGQAAAFLASNQAGGRRRKRLVGGREGRLDSNVAMEDYSVTRPEEPLPELAEGAGPGGL